MDAPKHGAGLSEDDEDCNACDAMKQMTSFKKFFVGAPPRRRPVNENEKEKEKQSTSSTSTTTATSSAGRAEERSEKEFWEMGFPADTIELGRSTWTLLHTMAAYYPEKPTEIRQDLTSTFLQTFAKVYPCNWCAKDFQGIMKRHPPRLNNRREFSQWMCEAHNMVNEHLGKPAFDCSRVDERWRAPNAHHSSE